MNKHLIFAVLSLLFISNVFGQAWFPIGAEWYFNQQLQLDYPAHGYTFYTVDSDTIIDSKNTKKIIFKTYNYHTGIAGKTSSLFVREENSKVFQWTGKEFKLMYDFTLNSGDTLDLEVIKRVGCDSVSPIVIDSVNYMVNSGETLRVQYLSCMVNTPPKNYYNTFKIIEKIGRIESFVFAPECGIDIEPWVSLKLRCYHDGNISFTSDWWSKFCPNSLCDTLIDGSTGVTSQQPSEQIILYPNPCESVLNINNSKYIIKNVFLYNSLGLLIYSFEPKNNFIKLNIESLVSGIYYVFIETENQIETRKIIKL